MRLVAILISALLVPAVHVAASEAQDCLVTPPPAGAPDASAAAGFPAFASAALSGLASPRVDVRVSEDRPLPASATTVEIVLRERHPDGFVATERTHYDLIGTRDTTCFMFVFNTTPWVVERIEAWANATAATSLTLDLWASVSARPAESH